MVMVLINKHQVGVVNVINLSNVVNGVNGINAINVPSDQCDQCRFLEEETSEKCRGCGLPLCGPQCQGGPWHRLSSSNVEV